MGPKSDTRRSPSGGRPPALLLIGAVPPPAYGVATATDLLRRSPVLAAAFRIVHLDTSDRRTVANMGRIDLVNVALAVRHELQLLVLLVRQRPRVAYFTLSQGPVAILRDWVFMRTLLLFGCRAVVHLRGSGYATVYQDGPGWLKWVMRDVFRRAARILVLGDGLVPMAKAIDASARVGVVPNGCPPVLTSSSDCEQPGSRGPLVSYLGVLHGPKGLHDTLRVVAGLLDDVPDLRCVLAGDWGSEADRHHAEALITEFGLHEHVEFPGQVHAAGKAELLGRSAVYLLASHAEGHPWSVIEAMSAGVPVVATRTGAVPDTVVDGGTGFLADVGDIAGLTAAVLRILTDHALAAEMSARARERYEELFTMERSHTLLLSELHKALDGAK